MRLNQQNMIAAVRGASPAINIPRYDRSQLAPGIVHLGLGAFHRAHQALYTEAAIAAGDTRWGIVGVSMRRADTRDALAPQDHLYTVSVRDEYGEQLQVAGALIRSLVAPEEPLAVLDAMADARCHIVSLTITEKGYCYDPSSRSLLPDHPDIIHDLHHSLPRTAIGFLVRALARRREQGIAPFTVVCCDNLPANGDTTRTMVVALAAQLCGELAHWIETQVAFPNSMVDRIVPRTTAEDIAHIERKTGMEDAWPVVTERFSQWVLQDRFSGPRPRWEDSGVTLVKDVAPYEHAKLRMLNGSHSTLAYLGSLTGHVTVDQAISDVQMSRFVPALLATEVEPTLTRPGLEAYRQELLVRFRNPALKHRLQQIAMDGSQKIAQRLLGTLRQRLADGQPCPRICFALAGWFRYLAGQDESGTELQISDPLATRLQACATASGGSVARVDALLGMRDVFGDDLPRDDNLRATLIRQLEAIRTQGVRQAMRTLHLD